MSKLLNIKPWREKELFKTPRVWSAEDSLESALAAGRLYQREGERLYKTRPRHIRAIWIEGSRCKGRRTRHFAWIGLPKDSGCGNTTFPAVVLVHGGGGTAFLRWVEKWNHRGYAAIAVDTCGHLPVAKKYGQWVDHPYSHHSTWGDFERADAPPSQQWCYHAVTSVVRAHSYLRTLEQVDPARIGITGISWGGYLTSIASSIDDRFRFAAPVYGCGFLAQDSPWKAILDKMPERRRQRWLRLWDPSVYLPMSCVPTLWTTGSNDFAYNLEMLRLSQSACGASSLLSVHIRYGHSHARGWRLAEPYAFADSLCRKGPKIIAPKVLQRDGQIEVAGGAFVSAVLCHTPDSCELTKRYWHQRRMKRNRAGDLAASLPARATAWFVNAVAPDGCITSSPLSIVSPS